MTPQRGASNRRVLFWSARRERADEPLALRLLRLDRVALGGGGGGGGVGRELLGARPAGGATSSSGTTIAAQQRQVTVKRAEWMCRAGDARLGDGAEVRYELVALDSYSLVVKRPDPSATRQYERTSSRSTVTP